MPLECVAAAIANCVGNLATECASPYLRYFFRFGKIVEDFKNKRNELKSKRDEVKDDVDEALRQTEVIKKGVEEWLTKAEKELGEAQSLEEEIERNKCFNWCPSCGWRYCLSIKVAKKTLYISQLLAEACHFQRVGRRPPLQGIEFLLPKDFMASESSISAFNGIMKALNSDGVNMIGLYGMPGVGKTTLAEVVGKKVQEKEPKLFDKVVIVTVSQTLDINKIQDKIADIFGLRFEKNSEEGKAEELWRRLKGEKKILIILDDVWKELELQTIGIPFGGEHEGCKILLTTRLQQVCSQMDCQEEFKLDILSDDGAWVLFKNKAGVEDDSPTLNVAKEVARECDGLPLAIVTVAKALKGRDLNGWMVANQRLKDSRHLDNQDVLYTRLKLSYDYLEDDDVKSCFLLCSLFPEDYEIPIEILVICGIGQGLFSNINSFEVLVLRREIYEALTKLQQSGLLLEIDDGENIKMHDVVRDFAHWITSRGEDMFMVKNELTEWPKSENFSCCTALSLWNCKIDNFSDRLEFAKLKILILSPNKYQRVQSTFFEGMKTLQVLCLDHLEFSMEALQFLSNLQTLCIRKCDIENISSLKNLKKLVLLCLVRTSIDELPEEVVELHGLKSLYFHCSGDEDSSVPPNLISRLTSLQELQLIGKTIANLSELNSLSSLSALTLTVSTDQCFQENFVFPKLQSYNIAVNGYIEILTKFISRILRIRDSSSLNAFKELFRNVEILNLEKVMEHKNVVPNVDQWGLNELTSLELASCNDLECLIDTTREQSPTTAFSKLVNLDIGKMTSLQELCHGESPNSFLQKLETLIICDCGLLQSMFQMNGQMRPISNLRSLELQSLPALESIWKEPTHHVSLQSLKDVKVDGCDKLESIFSPYLARSLLYLEQLKISACKKLEQVFAFAKDMAELEENQAPPLSNLICLELESLPELRCIWREPTHLVNLQSLKTMRIGLCSKLEYLFSPTLAQALVHLEELKIKESNSLKHLIMEAENGDEIVSNKDRTLLCWPKLKSLEIASCKSLRYVFPITLAQGLPYLESVQIIDCPQLMHVFNMAKEEDKHDVVLPKLQFLRLEDLENLSSFCPRNCFVKLPSFKWLEVCNVGPRPQVMSHSQNQQGLPWQFQLKDTEIDAVKELLYNVKSLSLERVMYHKNLVPNVDPKGLNELTFLALKDGKELECLIDTTEGHVSTTAFFNLVELVIQDMTSMKMLCNGRFPKGFLQKLEKLEARNCMEMVSLSPTSQNLKEVKVINCGQLQEVFQIDELLRDTKENQGPLLSNLKLMKLHSLPELNWIWKGSTRFVSLQSLKFVEISYCNRLNYLFSTSLAQSLVLLEELKIDHCDGLQIIITEPNAHLHSPFLPKLETLEITDCPRLEYVFQIPMAQVLPRLKSFRKTDSPQLQQVFHVAKETIGVDRAIALPCLQDLRLVNLINLGCFCSENFLISSPSLEELKVYNCPKLINFTIQKEVKEQVQLKELSLSKLGNNFQLHISANCNQEYIAVGSHEEVFQIHGRIKELHLEDLSEVQIIWKDVVQVATLKNLTMLEVIDCKRLRCLFPLGFACCLPKLEQLLVKGNSKLEQVFEVEDEAEAIAEKEIKFDQLQVLSLVELPSLVDFCPMGYHFVLPALSSLTVEGCPKMTTGFFIDSKGYVHAKTETQQLVEQDATERVAIAQNVVHTKTIEWCTYPCYSRSELPPYKEEL